MVKWHRDRFMVKWHRDRFMVKWHRDRFMVKWHRDRFIFQYFGFPPAISFHPCPRLIYLHRRYLSI